MGIFELCFRLENVSAVCVASADEYCLVLKRPENDPSAFGSNYPWEFSCGGSEINESPKKTAVREVYEEAGLRIEEKNLKFVNLGFKFNVKRDKGHVQIVLRLIHRYAVRLPENHEKVYDQVTITDEHVDKQMLRFDELRNLQGFPNVFQRFARKARRAIFA